MSLGLLFDKAYGFSINNDITVAAELEKRKNIYSNEEVIVSNFEWNDNLCIISYTFLQLLVNNYLQSNVIISDNCVSNYNSNIHILCLSHHTMCTNCKKPSKVHKNNKEWLKWISDTGASIYVTNDIEDFIKYEPITPVSIATAKKSQNRLQTIEQNTVIIEHYVKTQDGELTIAISYFYSVYYIPGLHKQLFSIRTMI